MAAAAPKPSHDSSLEASASRTVSPQAADIDTQAHTPPQKPAEAEETEVGAPGSSPSADSEDLDSEDLDSAAQHSPRSDTSSLPPAAGAGAGAGSSSTPPQADLETPPSSRSHSPSPPPAAGAGAGAGSSSAPPTTAPSSDLPNFQHFPNLEVLSALPFAEILGQLSNLRHYYLTQRQITRDEITPQIDAEFKETQKAYLLALLEMPAILEKIDLATPESSTLRDLSDYLKRNSFIFNTFISHPNFIKKINTLTIFSSLIQMLPVQHARLSLCYSPEQILLDTLTQYPFLLSAEIDIKTPEAPSIKKSNNSVKAICLRMNITDPKAFAEELKTLLQKPENLEIFNIAIHNPRSFGHFVLFMNTNRFTRTKKIKQAAELHLKALTERGERKYLSTPGKTESKASRDRKKMTPPVSLEDCITIVKTVPGSTLPTTPAEPTQQTGTHTRRASHHAAIKSTHYAAAPARAIPRPQPIYKKEIDGITYEVNRDYLYEEDAIQHILRARLAQHGDQTRSGIPVYIMAAVDNIVIERGRPPNQFQQRLEQEKLENHGARIALIPCNIDGSHWIGLLLEFSRTNECIRAEYIESDAKLKGQVRMLQQQLQNVYPDADLTKRIDLIQQPDAIACGLCMIENLILSMNGQAAERPRILEAQNAQMINLRFTQLHSLMQAIKTPLTVPSPPATLTSDEERLVFTAKETEKAQREKASLHAFAQGFYDRQLLNKRVVQNQVPIGTKTHSLEEILKQKKDALQIIEFVFLTHALSHEIQAELKATASIFNDEEADHGTVLGHFRNFMWHYADNPIYATQLADLSIALFGIQKTEGISTRELYDQHSELKLNYELLQKNLPLLLDKSPEALQALKERITAQKNKLLHRIESERSGSSPPPLTAESEDLSPPTTASAASRLTPTESAGRIQTAPSNISRVTLSDRRHYLVNTQYQYEATAIDEILAASLLLQGNQTKTDLPIPVSAQPCLSSQDSEALAVFFEEQQKIGRASPQIILIPILIKEEDQKIGEWAGLLFEFNHANQCIRAEWITSSPTEIPESLSSVLRTHLSSLAATKRDSLLQASNSSHSGVYLIQNFLLAIERQTAPLPAHQDKQMKELRAQHLQVLSQAPCSLSETEAIAQKTQFFSDFSKHQFWNRGYEMQNLASFIAQVIQYFPNIKTALDHSLKEVTPADVLGNLKTVLWAHMADPNVQSLSMRLFGAKGSEIQASDPKAQEVYQKSPLLFDYSDLQTLVTIAGKMTKLESEESESDASDGSDNPSTIHAKGSGAGARARAGAGAGADAGSTTSKPHRNVTSPPTTTFASHQMPVTPHCRAGAGAGTAAVPGAGAGSAGSRLHSDAPPPPPTPFASHQMPAPPHCGAGAGAGAAAVPGSEDGRAAPTVNFDEL